MTTTKRKLSLVGCLVIIPIVILIITSDQAKLSGIAFGMTNESDGLSAGQEGECEPFIQLYQPDLANSPATVTLSGDPEEITVLTYNTHLFGGSQVCDVPSGACYQDEIRKGEIIDRVKASGADIVALQEVWVQANNDSEDHWQDDFISVLSHEYPYAWYANGCPDSPVMIGSGLVLLSKWPLQEPSFKKFPVYDPDVGSDSWATKGVIAATMLVGPSELPVRIGISHSLTGGHQYKSKWDDAYVGTAITPFQLNGEPYVFSLKSDSHTAFLTRVEDYSFTDEDTGQKKVGAGYKDLIEGVWSSNYVAVESFELDGHPWLFGLKGEPFDVARITRINDDPSTGWTDINTSHWDSNYVGTAITSFQLNGHPYLFSLKKTGRAYITRINDDPATGTGWVDVFQGSWSSNYVAIESFELNGHPWLFALKGEPYNEAYFTRINDNPYTGWTDITKASWDSSYNGNTITSFQLNGQPYIFGLKTTWDQAWISRIRLNSQTGQIEYDDFMFPWNRDYVAIKAFELNGQPYLWALKDCCSQYPNLCPGSRPGELFITRIYEENGVVKMEDVNQLEDMKIIRDQTVKEGSPAIMMGDFNVHKVKYGFMDSIFEKAGAVDAYIAVHGTGEGGETIDRDNNNLYQIFSGSEPCGGSQSCFDRIDYIYVKQDGAGIKLIPKEAYVIRDWKYDDTSLPGSGPDRDLSDHYPLVATFELFATPVATFSATPEAGREPLTVQFTDQSTGNPTSWVWNFGDSHTSTEQHPSHKYMEAGVYTVKLTASNAVGSNTLVDEDCVEVLPLEKVYLPAINKP